jgi:hypothetical protein
VEGVNRSASIEREREREREKEREGIVTSVPPVSNYQSVKGDYEKLRNNVTYLLGIISHIPEINLLIS